LSIIDQAVHAAPTAQHINNDSDVVRGAKGIAQVLGLPRRSVEHMLARGYLKSPHRIGHAWYASRSRLMKEIVGNE
jgi:hypothetical protein